MANTFLDSTVRIISADKRIDSIDAQISGLMRERQEHIEAIDKLMASIRPVLEALNGKHVLVDQYVFWLEAGMVQFSECLSWAEAEKHYPLKSNPSPSEAFSLDDEPDSLERVEREILRNRDGTARVVMSANGTMTFKTVPDHDDDLPF